MNEPIQMLPHPEEIAALTKAFADFQSRADLLATAYAQMQSEFRNVNLELEATNSRLTESLKKEEETQTYLNSILASMNNGVIGVDVMGTITQFNRAAKDITGFTIEETLGKSFRDVFTCEAASEQSVLTVLANGKELSRDEKVIWHKDGHPVPVSYQTALLADDHGGTLGAVEIFSDISRIKALEADMRHAKTMAALGEMAATVAHEIRNPLGAMGMWANLLERDIDPADSRRKTLSRIIEGLARLNRIVSNLLVYSRPVKAQLRPVPLGGLLDEISDFVQIEIERLGQNITVCKEFDASSDICVEADPEKLHQIVMNVCFNAIQAMPSGGVLTVHIEIDSVRSGYVSFCIIDTGEGIPKEMLEKIFDPFYTTKENGTGLGLAIVKKFIEFHSGHIAVDSERGLGTTIRIFLPRSKV